MALTVFIMILTPHFDTTISAHYFVGNKQAPNSEQLNETATGSGSLGGSPVSSNLRHSGASAI
jgi:hypothetical protein